MGAKEAVLAEAVDLARAAAEQTAARASDVGAYMGLTQEGERVVTHMFAADLAGYTGWFWAVTLARVPRGKEATVSEVELLPGETALVAPKWVPWAERIRPEDIGPGDVIPFVAADPRLEPGWQPPADKDAAPPAIEELALARARVLNMEGRAETAARWYRGKHGPTTAGSLRASAACATCAFALPLSGSMGQIFAVCSNYYSPDDGQVVSLDHGCGAHSETDVEHVSVWPPPSAVIDELLVAPFDLAPTDLEPAEPQVAVEPDAGTLADAAAEFEGEAREADAAIMHDDDDDDDGSGVPGVSRSEILGQDDGASDG